MTPAHAASLHARGTAVRLARRQRVRMIRRRVITGALALFVALWLLITLMLVTGHDPALAKAKSSVATAGTSSATTSTRSGAGTRTATSSSTGTSSGASTGTSSAVSPSTSGALTTRQS